MATNTLDKKKREKNWLSRLLTDRNAGTKIHTTNNFSLKLQIKTTIKN